MLIRQLDPAKFVHAYGIDIQLLYPWEGTVTTPFGAAWAVVPPGGSTKHHNHQEGETFFIARGEGVMQVGEESSVIKSGDVVFQQPFHQHTLTNTSTTDDLLFLTVWWEDKDLWVDRKEGAAEKPNRRVLVTAAPPTPNGHLHLGHLSGPYTAADIVARALRLQGVPAYFACGSDDNSIYVKSKAKAIGKSPAEAAEMFVASIEESFRLAKIDLAAFVHPNESPHHVPLVQEFFKRLYDGGKLVEREMPSPYCAGCDLYLWEPYISGRCPHCNGGVVGNTCEDCGRVNDCINLKDPTCTTCGKPATTRATKRLFFPLSQHAEVVREFHRGVTMNPHLRAFCEKLLADGLPDVAVTHPSDWGIPVPVPGYEGQRIYVWLEMAPRYFAYGRHALEKAGIAGDWDHFWRSPEGEVIQCYGFDNSFYYTCFLPALFKAFDPAIKLPVAFVANEFYRLDGLKFSTSRGHAIWAREILGKLPADVIRFYLAWSAPEAEGTNFTREDFRATVERELLCTWQPWLAALGSKLANEMDGLVPSTGDWRPEHGRFFHRVQQLVRDAAQAYDAASFSPQQAARTLSELVRTAARFGKAEEFWRGVPERGEERRTGIALELMAAKTLALLAAPLMPDFANRLWQGLGYSGDIPDGAWENRPDWVPSGQRVSGLDRPFFPSADELAAGLMAGAGG